MQQPPRRAAATRAFSGAVLSSGQQRGERLTAARIATEQLLDDLFLGVVMRGHCRGGRRCWLSETGSVASARCCVAGYPETAVTTRPIAKPTPALMEPTTIT